MSRTNRRVRVGMAAVACAAVAAGPALGAFTTATKTFQQNVNGYTGEQDVQFTSDYRETGTPPSTTHETAGDAHGATGTQLFVDGYNGNDSPDQQVFLKFNSLFGTGANQIPVGAFIIDASLTLTTGTSTSAQSNGPFGVAPVLVPWTAASTYNGLKPAGSAENGLDQEDGVIGRSVASYDDPTVYFGGTNGLESQATSTTKGTNKYRYSASVQPIVQGWAANAASPTSGFANNGFTIHAGNAPVTTDGWQIKTATNGTAGDRPLLNVTYTTAAVQTSHFQQGVNNYNATTMVKLQDDGQTIDGAGLENAFLDGYQFSTDPDSVSPDDHALVKFGNVFTSEGGTVPKTARIVKAYLKVTTSSVSNAQTQQVYETHQMLRDWNGSTTYSDFGDFGGPQPGTGETAAGAVAYSMLQNSDTYFDVTGAVASWATGSPNYGFDIKASADGTFQNTNGTTDGWSIYFTGAVDPTVRPELIVDYVVRLPGDANEDGKIDADDFALTDRGFLMNRTGWENGDFNVDGVVNAADYLILDGQYLSQGGHFSADFLAAREAEFGAGYVAALMASVPEPGSCALLVACGSLLVARRRRGAERE